MKSSHVQKRLLLIKQERLPRDIGSRGDSASQWNKKEELLLYAASAEQESSHILARSLVNNVKNSQLYPVSQLKEVTGQGIKQ